MDPERACAMGACMKFTRATAPTTIEIRRNRVTGTRVSKLTRKHECRSGTDSGPPRGRHMRRLSGSRGNNRLSAELSKNCLQQHMAINHMQLPLAAELIHRARSQTPCALMLQHPLGCDAHV